MRLSKEVKGEKKEVVPVPEITGDAMCPDQAFQQYGSMLDNLVCNAFYDS